MENQNGQFNVNVNLKDAEDIKCEQCESLVFEEKIMIKKISKFLTGSDRDSISPIPVIACAKCGNINDMFKPKL
jgi:hypothetical protein